MSREYGETHDRVYPGESEYWGGSHFWCDTRDERLSCDTCVDSCDHITDCPDHPDYSNLRAAWERWKIGEQSVEDEALVIPYVDSWMYRTHEKDEEADDELAENETEL